MAIAKSPLMLLLTATFMMWIILWNFTTGYKQSMYWVWMFFFTFVCTVSSGRTILPPDPEVVGDGEDAKSTSSSTGSPALCPPES